MEFLFVLTILLNAGGLALQWYLLRKRQIAWEKKPDLLDRMEKEVGELVTEMNQTADRNLTLLEQRLGQLQRLVQDADKKILVLRKEGDKDSSSAKVYSHLAKSKSLETKGPTLLATVTEDSVPETGSGLEKEKNPLRSPGTEVPADEILTAAAVAAPSPRSTRQKVLDLVGAGMSPAEASKALGITLAEVELILSLGRR